MGGVTDMSEPEVLRVAAVLLVAATFLAAAPAGAVFIVQPEVRRAWVRPFRSRFQTMQAHPRAWRVALGAFGASAIVLAVGVAALAVALSAAEVSIVAVGAAVAFGIATTLIVATTTFGLAATYPPPDAVEAETWRNRLEPLNWWGYVNEVAYSSDCLCCAIRARLGDCDYEFAAWLGWLLFAVGAAFSANILTGVPRIGGATPAEIPYWIHILGLLIGVTALATG